MKLSVTNLTIDEIRAHAKALHKIVKLRGLLHVANIIDDNESDDFYKAVIEWFTLGSEKPVSSNSSEECFIECLKSDNLNIKLPVSPFHSLELALENNFKAGHDFIACNN